MLLAIGFLRLGTFIKYIPYAVTVGFTAGIAVIIFSGEMADLFGLKLAGKEPGPIIPKFAALFDAAATVNSAAVTVAALSLGAIVAVRRSRPHWPAYLIAVVARQRCRLGVPSSHRDDRQPIWRHSEFAAGAAFADAVAG